MNKRALLISFIIGFIIFIIGMSIPTESMFPLDFLALGFAAFVISALLFNIKPELMGKLNKPNKEDDNNEDKE